MLEAAGVKVQSLGDLASVWDPPRFARAYAAPAEAGIPYLRPYDVFDYLPDASDRLALLRNRDIARLTIADGDLLQTCSGRNLGPVTMADESLAGLALSHDMIRISVTDPAMRVFLLAYLKSSVGQALLRRGRSGSVIDHITVSDVASLPVAVPTGGVFEDIVTHAEISAEEASIARKSLRSLVSKYARDDQGALLEGVSDVSGGAVLGSTARAGRNALGTYWTMHASELPDRLDAGYYAPQVRAARQRAASDGVRLGDLATAHLPVRYKRYYVESGHGRPILSGRQLLQFEPVNLRYVSDRSFRDPAQYELVEGMTVFGAVGRAEGKQGAPALITAERSSWLASNDVMRLVPRAGVDPAALWLAVASAESRLQINALSFGSVVDHMNPGDVENIWVPSVDPSDAASANDAWLRFGHAAVQMGEAVRILEGFLSQGTDRSMRA
ncbi:restriction endonuclease subunit S domain-containing protein [Nocardioides marmoraquaticus]